jgi:hypothetical protein
MIRKLVHKFWSKVLGIPMPQPRIPRLQVGQKIDEKIRQKIQRKLDWDMGWRTRELVDEQMGNLGNTSWWPAKWESFQLINDDEEEYPNWEQW